LARVLRLAEGLVKQAEDKSALVTQMHLVVVTGDDGMLGVALNGNLSLGHG
jgi:hypothetical protein